MTFHQQVRLILALLLDVWLCSWAWPTLAAFSSVEAEARKHFWTAGAAALTLVLLWPILRRSPKLARFAAGFLGAVPVVVLGLVGYSYFRRL